MSEPEKFGIEAFYYFTVTGELDKAMQTNELWQQTYPRNYQPYLNLGVISENLGNYEKALNELSESLRLEPNDVRNYAFLGSYGSASDVFGCRCGSAALHFADPTPPRRPTQCNFSGSEITSESEQETELRSLVSL